jgi:hypothetical protein
MLTVKSALKEIENWELKKKDFLRDLEETLNSFDWILGKENSARKSEVKEVNENQPKADLLTVRHMIKAGIFNLRKSASPTPEVTGKQVIFRSDSNRIKRQKIIKKDNKKKSII